MHMMTKTNLCGLPEEKGSLFELIASKLQELYATGSKAASRWLEELRDSMKWDDAVKLWLGFPSYENGGPLAAERSIVRFFLAQILAAKASTVRDVMVWLLELAEDQLRDVGDAAARYLAAVAVKNAIRAPQMSGLDASLRKWIEFLSNPGPEIAVAVQMLRCVAEAAQQAISEAAPRSTKRITSSGVELSAGSFSVAVDSTKAAHALSAEAVQVLHGFVPSVVQALRLMIMPDDRRRDISAVLGSDECVESLMRSTLKCLDAWLTYAAAEIQSEPQRLEPVLQELANAEHFRTLVSGEAPRDADCAATLITMAELATQTLEHCKSRNLIACETVLRGIAEAAIVWWQGLWLLCNGNSSIVSDREADAAMRWCLLITALAPQLLDLGAYGEQLLSALLLLLMNLARWPSSVREAALEPWSSFLGGVCGRTPMVVDPRLATSRSHDKVLRQLQIELTKALIVGLQASSEGSELLPSLRDRATALLVEWRIATREDVTFDVALATLQADGIRNWRTVEVAHFLIGTAAPRICRMGSSTELDSLLNVLAALRHALQLSTPGAIASVQLRATIAVLARKAAPAISRSLSEQQSRTTSANQTIALDSLVLALGGNEFRSVLNLARQGSDIEAARLAEEALRLGASALAAVAREGAWLCPSAVLCNLRTQLDASDWLPDAGGIFVRAYCSIIAELPEADSLEAFEALCGPLVASVRADGTTFGNQSQRHLRFLLTALHVAPVSLCCDAEPCAVRLLSEVWSALEASPLMKEDMQNAVLADILAVVTAYSEVQSVRQTWMPRLAEALPMLGPKPQALQAATALFEVYGDGESPIFSVLQKLLFELLTLTDQALRAQALRLRDDQREALLSAVFDLLAASGHAGSIAPAQARAWALVGLAELPHARSPELVRSILGHCSSVPCLEPLAVLTAALRALAIGGCPAIQADGTLAASFARAVQLAVRQAPEGVAAGEVRMALASVPIAESVMLRFERLCTAASQGSMNHADLAKAFTDVAGSDPTKTHAPQLLM